MELLTNLVRRVGTRLTELLANRFAMQCNKKFNEMRSPAHPIMSIFRYARPGE